MSDLPCRFMEVRDEAEGEDVCERLRAAGVKCAVEQLPDPNSFNAIWDIPAPTVLIVLVNDQDVEKARAVISKRNATET